LRPNNPIKSNLEDRHLTPTMKRKSIKRSESLSDNQVVLQV
jgi:hypothetical protein